MGARARALFGEREQDSTKTKHLREKCKCESSPMCESAA